jgi:hypothetical protein
VAVSTGLLSSLRVTDARPLSKLPFALAQAPLTLPATLTLLAATPTVMHACREEGGWASESEAKQREQTRKEDRQRGHGERTS